MDHKALKISLVILIGIIILLAYLLYSNRDGYVPETEIAAARDSVSTLLKDKASTIAELTTARNKLIECEDALAPLAAKELAEKNRQDSLAALKEAKKNKKQPDLSHLASRINALEDQLRKGSVQTPPKTTTTTTPSGNYQTNYPEVSPPTKSTGKIVEFCFLYDNNERWHMPQYAIDQNWTPTSNVKKNDEGTGHNFYVRDPEDLVSEPTGLAGLTTDGRFFVLAEFFERFSPVTGQFDVYAKNALTGWNTPRKTRLEGGYYIYKK